LGPAVCVIGKSGIGKTWAVHKALDPCVELTADILKSKQDTIDFLNKINGTNIPVIIDEYECISDLVGIREIKKPPTNGLFVVISQIPVKFDFELAVYNFPVPDRATIKGMFPGASDDVIDKCAGDLRHVIQSLSFKSDDRNFFQTPREFLASIVSRRSDVNPMVYCGAPIQEPGNIAAVLHENYPDSKGDMAKISEQLSFADVIETKVYEGDWSLLPYFNLWGCVMPAVEIKHTLSNKLRPGSTWTKYQNACMRSKKLRDVVSRVPRNTLCIDSLLLIRSEITKGDFDNFFHYGLTAGDLAIMNHLSPLHSLEAKTIASLKKQCAEKSANR
jgi:hypothetical protein